jgi:hypothetical protein
MPYGTMWRRGAVYKVQRRIYNNRITVNDTSTDVETRKTLQPNGHFFKRVVRIRAMAIFAGKLAENVKNRPDFSPGGTRQRRFQFYAARERSAVRS